MSGATSQPALADEMPVRGPDGQEVADGLRDLLGVVNSSRGLDEILQYVVGQAVGLLGAAAAALYLRHASDARLLCLQAERNLPAEGITPVAQLGYPVMGLAASRGRPVLVHDFRRVLAEPFASRVDDQLAERGDYLEVLRPGPISAPDPVQQERNRVLAARYPSIAALPLLARDKSHGALVLYHHQPAAFSVRQVELACVFANQAGLAIENAQLRAQAEQRLAELERRRHIAESLRELLAVVNSGRPLAEMLAAALEQAVHLLGSQAGAVYLCEALDQPTRGDDEPAGHAGGSDMLRVHASRGLRPDQLAVRLRVGSPVTGLAVARRRPVVCDDLRAALADDLALASQSQLDELPGHVRVVRMGPALDPDLDTPAAPRVRRLSDELRGVLAVPLASRERSYGAITLFYAAAHPFAEEEIRLAQMFADQAALAVENAYLHGEADRRLRQLEALYRADETLHRSLDLDRVLQALVDVAGDVLQADKTSVLVWNEQHTRLVPGATRGFAPETVAQMSHAPGEGVTTVVALTGTPVVVPDATHDPRVAHRITGPEGIHSLMHVPVTIGEQVFGVFGVNYCQPHPFTDAEQRLLQALAQRAAVAIHNARLYGESEQRRRELEALYRADGDLHRSLRLDEVLQTLVDLPVEIGQAEMVSLLLWDERQQRFVVGGARGLSQAILSETFTMAETRIPRDRHDALVEVTDAASDQRISDRMRQTVERESVRAWLGSPIRIGGRLFGSLSFGYGHPHAFSDHERRLLVALAQRAALAIHNARLHQESEERRLELEALYRADEQIHGSLHLREVLQALVDVATAILHAEQASVLVWNADEDRLVIGAMRGYRAGADELTFLPGEAGIFREALEGDLLPIGDVRSDPRLSPRLREILVGQGIGSALSAPIRMADQVFGLFSVAYANPRDFDEAECRLLVALAGRAGLAIQNAHLYEQAQQAATLEERQRLARELHDAVTQTLFSASLIAEVTPRLWERNPEAGRQRLAELRILTRGALAEMRTLLLELRPSALLELSLGHLLRQLAEATSSRAKLDVQVRLDADPSLEPAVQVALYRIAQEALNNVTKHAHAKRVEIVLSARGDELELLVADDGHGFELGRVPAGHLGLGIMRERADAIGARLELSSRPGEGTRVLVHWRPLP